MNWFLVALLPPALWSVTNHIDKYLLSKYFRGQGVGALMIFSSIIGFLLLPIFALLHPEVLHFGRTSALIMVNGFLYVLAILPYFYAMVKDEASVVVPLFQMTSVITFLLAYVFLGETLQANQLVGGMLIILGAVGISLDLTHAKRIRLKSEVLGLMILSSLVYSLNFLFFKYFAIESNYWYVGFWEYVGFGLFALLLMAFVKSYREEFLTVFRKNSWMIIGLNGVNEILNLMAKITFNVISLTMPIALTWIVNGFQPFFVVLYGIILTIFFPRIAKENIERKVLVQKIIAILVMFAGGVWLNK